MTNKIDKKITLLWNDIRDLCQTRKLMTKKRSYWYNSKIFNKKRKSKLKYYSIENCSKYEQEKRVFV